jgi:hypothetical protein
MHFSATLDETMELDHRYNRTITPHARIPWADFGSRGLGSTTHQGYIKCKLAHGMGYSVVVPDALFLGSAADKWIQPLAFGPNVLGKCDAHIRCAFSVDVSCGHRLSVEFNNDDLVSTLADGAELYRCTFSGPPDLRNYATGDSSFVPGHAPYLRLYHHTSVDAKQQIERSREFWGSKWNIQGTHKKLTNVAYVYFTPLDRVVHPDDLKMIAMSSEGKLTFAIDGFVPPVALMPDWEDTFKNQILVLPVYRASTGDRTETLEFDIDSTLLTPQHVLRHSPPGEPVWYEIATPFVHRVGIEPSATLKFSSGKMDYGVVQTKHFDYVVVGDATTVEGLAAPYDEEDTRFLLKIERPPAGTNMLEFWFEHGNQDLYSDKRVETQTLEQVTPVIRSKK